MQTGGSNINASGLLRSRASAGQGGQSLIELLLAIGISAILVGGATVAIALALRVDTANKPVQAALFAVQDLLDKVAALAESDWRTNINALSPPPATYSVRGTDGTLAIVSGGESIAIDEVQYTRSFTAEPVYRDATGAINSSGTLDPSTKKVIATAEWQDGSRTSQFSLAKFVTRARNFSTGQVDWSGGSGQSGSYAAPDKYDTSDASVDTTSQPGTIKLRLQ